MIGLWIELAIHRVMESPWAPESWNSEAAAKDKVNTDKAAEDKAKTEKQTRELKHKDSFRHEL